MAFAFSAPDTVRRDAPVAFRFTATNAGNATFALETALPGETYNFVVRDARDALVWDRLTAFNGGYVREIVSGRPLAPGEQVAYTATWDQRRTGGGRVGAGTYRVFAVLWTLLAEGPGRSCFRTAARTLTIVD